MEGEITNTGNGQVTISGVTYGLGQNVKPQFIKMGKCEYSLDDTKQYAVYIKMIKEQQGLGGFNAPATAIATAVSNFRKPIEIIRQECLTTAKDILIAINPEKLIVDTVIAYATELEDYVTHGKKSIQQGQVPTNQN